MDWEECCIKEIVKNVNPDIYLIKSLIKSSKNKLESQKRLQMSDITASSKLTLAYDSLRELLEALSLKEGYKVYNHECYTAFLKEIIGKKEKGYEFNEIRKIRNAINYYGKDISAKEAQEVITKIKKLRSFISSLMI